MIRELGKRLRPFIGHLKFGQVFERKLLKKLSQKEGPPPIFIVGPPRSGSTLFYQILHNHFETAFFSNFTSVFIEYPVTMSRLTKRYHVNSQVKSYESDYGVTEGIFAPSEAGGIYRHWFENTDLDTEMTCKLKDTCHAMAVLYQKPFVWKNLNLSIHIKTLKELFPNAYFLKIDRQLAYVAQSIYLKYKSGGQIDVVGVDPDSLKSYENLLQGIGTEIKNFDDKLNAELTKDASTRVMSIAYEDIFSRLQALLEEIEEFYNSSGYRLVRRDVSASTRLSNNNKRKLSGEEWQLLSKVLSG